LRFVFHPKSIPFHSLFGYFEKKLSFRETREIRTKSESESSRPFSRNAGSGSNVLIRFFGDTNTKSWDMYINTFGPLPFSPA
jgi:hypothetical protein